MITTLTPAEGDRVWKSCGTSWPFYAFRAGEWRCYPVDPRRGSPVTLISNRASQQVDGTITHKTGFEEVP